MECQIPDDLIDSLLRQKTNHIAVEKALAAIKKGQLVECSRIEYIEDVRAALQEFAGEMIDEGQDVYAQLALEEAKRLDREFAKEVDSK